MTVRRIKQLTGLIGAWTAVAVVAVTLAMAGFSVVAAGTGADPASAFTDPTAQRQARETTWVIAGSEIHDESTKFRIEMTWNETLNSVLERPNTTDIAVGSNELEVVFFSAAGDFLQLRSRVTIARSIAGEVVVNDEEFDVTLVQQPTGWMVANLQRVAS